VIFAAKIPQNLSYIKGIHRDASSLLLVVVIKLQIPSLRDVWFVDFAIVPVEPPVRSQWNIIPQISGKSQESHDHLSRSGLWVIGEYGYLRDNIPQSSELAASLIIAK
jgi:hypothetical protein